MKYLYKSAASIVAATVAAFCGLSSSAEAASFAGSAAQPRYVTVGDPSDYVVSPGSGFDGVVDLRINAEPGAFRCTGSLLNSGRHILTAAHCLTDFDGNFWVDTATASFDLPTGRVSLDAANFFVYSDWGGFADIDSFGGDIAIIELASEAPSEVERYDIYRGTDEIGQVGTKVGYGRSGTGNEGDVLRSGTKRVGQNVYDAPAEILSSLPSSFNYLSNSLLAYDFDNGLAENDAFGYYFGLNDLGLGLNEVNSAPGDSGGPTFINGLIAGVTSFGFCPTLSFDSFECLEGSDLDGLLNSSYGEFSGDTRVSTYASWIDGITSRSVPEPGVAIALFLTSFVAVVKRKSLQKQH